MLVKKLTKIGNSVGLTLPKEVLSRMDVSDGDTLYLTETANGYEITPYNVQFERQVEAADRTMKRYRNALRELAK